MARILVTLLSMVMLYELDDEFNSYSHIKLVLNDITDPENPVLLDYDLLNKNDIPGFSNDYTLHFSEALDDGNYRIIITDLAGNEVKGTDEEHLFTIDETNPIMTDLALYQGFDMGVSDIDRNNREKTKF